MSLIRNAPCDTGRKIGKMIADFADSASPEYAVSFAKEGMPVPQRCRTCAFRHGTFANSCMTTTADALKCVMEHVDFVCHEKDAMTPEGRQVCVGWAMLMTESIQGKHESKTMPWQFSDEIPEP